MTTVALPHTEPAEQRTEHPYVIIVNGQAMVRGSRIAVRLIAQMHREGDTVDDIQRSYPHLSAAAAHDAISYYLDHRAEIEEEIAEHRIENVLARSGATMNERGFITLPPAQANG
ncbi:MAG: DUF433 domain-containing protein [Chloroflexi bacterium]|nr:DUF433 domain-containing protein [Chloroflexota bacterium]